MRSFMAWFLIGMALALAGNHPSHPADLVENISLVYFSFTNHLLNIYHGNVAFMSPHVVCQLPSLR